MGYPAPCAAPGLHLIAPAVLLATAVTAQAFSLEEMNRTLFGGSSSTEITSWDLLGLADVRWVEKDGIEQPSTFIPPDVAALDGETVRLAGFMMPVEADVRATHFVLMEIPADCPFCVISIVGPSRMVEVRAARPIEYVTSEVKLEGRLEVLPADADGLVYRLHETTLVD